MPKSATGWLFDQLREHPDFWLPPVKELRYLFFPRPRMDNAVDLLKRYSDPVRRQRAQPADVAFTEEAAALSGQPRDFEKYAALFRFRGERLSGDISPGYCQLQPARIQEVAARFPQAKILLLVRDPVDRLWSHLSMAKREKKFDEGLLEERARFFAWFEKSPIRRQSFATETLARWREYAPALPLRYFLFDDIVANPAAVRRDALDFLGADPQRKSGKIPAHFNRKAHQPKLTRTEPAERMLIEAMAGEVRACARAFGGAAETWPARYGL